MKKYTQEEVNKIFQNNGYTVLGEYIDCVTPILIEKDGYKANMILHNVLTNDSKANFFGMRNPYHDENFALFINRKSPDIKYVSSKGIRKGGKYRIVITLKCKCGKIFNRQWEHVCYCSDLMCNDCISLKQSIKATPKNIKIIEDNGYTVLNKDIMVNNKTRVEVIQNSTGYKGYIDVAQARKNGKFTVFSLYGNYDNYLYNAKILINNYNPNLEVLGIVEQQKKHPLIRVKCECGEIFETTIFHFQQGKTRCNKCSSKQSNREFKIEKFLQEQDILYRTEYKFNGCCDLLPLPFDFHLTDYDILIEVDGEQHEKPIRFGGMSIEQANKNFIEQKKRDKIKDDYCLKNNIPLIRISYKDIDNNDNYKEIIKNAIYSI